MALRQIGHDSILLAHDVQVATWPHPNATGWVSAKQTEHSNAFGAFGAVGALVAAAAAAAAEGSFDALVFVFPL